MTKLIPARIFTILLVCRLPLTFALVSRPVDEMKVDFPYWERLHGYWRTLPNFNPLTVTSEPDQDLEGGALDLFQNGNSQSAANQLQELGFEDEPPAHPAFSATNSLTPEEQLEIEGDPDADGEDDDMADPDVCAYS